MQPPDNPSPSTPPSERPESTWFDYVLIAGTCVLFLAYLPLFARVPRLLSVPLRDGDPFWMLPMLMMGGCLAGLCCWIWQGLTDLGRSIWAAVFALAVLGYPFAFGVALFTGPG